MNKDYDRGFEYDTSRDPWYAPILIILAVVAAFIALVFVFNAVAKADEADTYIVRIVGTIKDQPAVIWEFRPNDQANEFKTKEDCEVLLTSPEFVRSVAVPGMWAMHVQYGSQLDSIQQPECIASSEEAKQIEQLKEKHRLEKGDEL